MNSGNWSKQMQSSNVINELATALSKAQGEITGALKDSANPFYKSKYSDLASCWDACRAALSTHGLAVTQFPTTKEDGKTYLVTGLLHTSGQWMRSDFLLTPKDDTSQGMGSAITYARRYALCAVVGVAQVDDDGNAASGRPIQSSGGIDPRGDMGKGVDPAKVQDTVKRMLDLMDQDLAGDHEGVKKAAIVLDYHEKVLNPDADLYVAVGDVLTAAKRNAWKAYVAQAKKLEAAEPRGRKF
jgi:ERF superfamily